MAVPSFQVLKSKALEPYLTPLLLSSYTQSVRKSCWPYLQNVTRISLASLYLYCHQPGPGYPHVSLGFLPWSPYLILTAAARGIFVTGESKHVTSTAQNHPSLILLCESCASYRATVSTSGPRSLPLIPSDDTPCSLCFSLADLFAFSRYLRHAPTSGSLHWLFLLSGMLVPRVSPLQVFSNVTRVRLPKLSHLKWQSSLHAHLAPSLLCFPKHLCRICYLFSFFIIFSPLECEFLTVYTDGCIPSVYNGNWHTVNVVMRI